MSVTVSSMKNFVGGNCTAMSTIDMLGIIPLPMPAQVRVFGPDTWLYVVQVMSPIAQLAFPGTAPARREERAGGAPATHGLDGRNMACPSPPGPTPVGRWTAD